LGAEAEKAQKEKLAAQSSLTGLQKAAADAKAAWEAEVIKAAALKKEADVLVDAAADALIKSVTAPKDQQAALKVTSDAKGKEAADKQLLYDQSKKKADLLKIEYDIK